MKQIIVLLFVLFSGCKTDIEHYLMSDIEKDALKGPVASVKVYASRRIEIYIFQKNDDSGWIKGNQNWNETKDTIFEILLTQYFYNESGYRTEFIKFQNAEDLAKWKYSNPSSFLEPGYYKSEPLKINDKLFQHFIYSYNEYSVLRKLIRLNPDKSIKSISAYYYTPFMRNIIDSTFYENGGFIYTYKTKRTKFGLDKPIWALSNPGLQFDKTHNILIDGKIHYYYEDFDEYGNWINATKYYDGPNKNIPVSLKREILYY